MRFIDYFTLVSGTISILAVLWPLAERHKILDKVRGHGIKVPRRTLLRVLAVVVCVNVVALGLRAMFGGVARADEVRNLISKGEYRQAETLLLQGDPDKEADEFRQLKAAIDCGRSRIDACFQQMKALAEGGDLGGDEPEAADALSHLLDGREPVADLVRIAQEIDDEARLVVLKDKAGAATGIGRQNALAVLAALGEDKAVDRESTYAAEFARARSCKQIKAVAARAKEAKDKASLPALRQLNRRVKDSFFKDLCVGTAVEEAIKATEGG